MALMTRVSKLFRADIHAVLDRIEEPEVLLRQAIRDMEEELVQEQHRCSQLHHEHAQLGARKSDLEQSLETFEAELDVCFESAKEALARTLIRRKLEIQRQLKSITRKRTALESSVATMNTRIHDNRARLDGLRQKAELITEHNPVPYAEDDWDSSDCTVADADVEIAFLREQQKRSPS